LASAAAAASTRRLRRDEILAVAVDLFARRGYHGVSMDDIGTAAGVTGPALYHHFAGKDAMLAAAFTPICEDLLAGGRQRVEAATDEGEALRSLVGFHLAFALGNPAVIALYLHELDRLPTGSKRVIRRLQRLYVEVWVTVLVALRPEWSAPQARVAAHAAFGLMNSTPFLGPEIDPDTAAELLAQLTLTALLPA
jgi:AcrR family transcriptional regulator